ncbi:UDP-glucose 4-epimerase GalE [Cellulomonas cellasea]|uniref:UDP-glucose 4-epimerase n=2 Tax=Cellulomonas cellasea TaxID=43670 RepID=A0A0A0BDY0_9CELL|nr:UDP-glucose 4-epimerase GalE [Cellulomonas cellasea]KGM03511.1 UDP-glucose 4-epimerase [Cellulomonas cellasea DSM 20118]GEA87140.1 UDP-glucose 4-epimerase GalE [Cellulomonas cellasea]
MDILITGGAGFIGSTIASAALDAGHRPVVLDNLVTGRREFTAGRTFYEGDIADRALVHRVLDENPGIAAVVHCAALIVVPDSVARPLDYYRANVTKALDLVATLVERGVHRLIFSSSASMYRPSEDFSVDESSALAPTSPYARTKMVVEGALEDVAAATDLRVLSLRYFNPIGADPQLRTGLQLAAPSHALGQLVDRHRAGQPFALTGVDYDTRDGSGIRDYVHVWDLALAHVAALERFDEALAGDRHSVVNLGTGTGTTVKELVAAFEDVTGEHVDVVEHPRRPGDSAGAYTRSDKAREVLGWTAQRSVRDGIADSLAWIERRGSVLPDLAG